MSGAKAKNFNLPWHQHDHYWISLYAKGGDFSAPLLDTLQKSGLEKLPDGGMSIQTGRDWKTMWDQVFPVLEHRGALDQVEASVTHGPPPSRSKNTLDCKPPLLIQLIAGSLWVGEALLEDRLMCYLQPVVGAKDKVFGYEAFARVKSTDGDIIGGEQIIAASRALGIEFVIDRHLHVEAIKTFASSQFNGFLFVNFFPGFIHRPAVYLEGLSETAKSFGLIAKHIVLDFTKSETTRDVTHMKNVADYGRSRGYSIALDDIISVENARRLVAEIRPDFVKIDTQLVRRVTEPPKRETIREIVELVHTAGGTVIAEGVETAEIHQALKLLGVDLFQGFLFSPPVPVEAALKRSTGTV